jgi:hypothetical protein
MVNLQEDLSRIGKQLMFSEPFYGIFMSTLNKVVRKDLPTAGVSKNNINYQLAINEEFWNSLDNDKKKIGLLKHELLHICFNHLEDREWFPNHELHNIAADLEINQYLTPEYYPMDGIILLSSFPELNLPEKALWRSSGISSLVVVFSKNGSTFSFSVSRRRANSAVLRIFSPKLKYSVNYTTAFLELFTNSTKRRAYICS